MYLVSFFSRSTLDTMYFPRDTFYIANVSLFSRLSPSSVPCFTIYVLQFHVCVYKIKYALMYMYISILCIDVSSVYAQYPMYLCIITTHNLVLRGH